MALNGFGRVCTEFDPERAPEKIYAASDRLGVGESRVAGAGCRNWMWRKCAARDRRSRGWIRQYTSSRRGAECRPPP